MSITFEDLLARDGSVVYKTRGVSMEPMIRQDRDLVTLRRPTSRLKKYDVILYRRGEKYVLHRIVGVCDDHYLVRGDNTFVLETVTDGDILGVLTGFKRKGRAISTENRAYRLYARLWHAVYPLRLACFRLRRPAGRFARRFGLLPRTRREPGKGSPA